MLKENLKDASIIIDNILTQPLSVAGAIHDVSLLDAASHFHRFQGETSDLRLILHSFLDYPDPTKSLVVELELLAKELAHA